MSKTQREFIHDYNNKYRAKFNEQLFVRNDDDLIAAIKDVIYSCERDASFTIKVMNFEVISDYDDINHILWEYEEAIINKSKKSSSSKKNKKDNQFAFINLKDSDLKLIRVTYFIQITEKKNGLVNDTITVYIAVPRLVNDFYFRINGNMYSAMYQIVDASTYNNSTAKAAKKQSITFKTMFMPIRVFRYTLSLNNISGEAIPCTYFVANMFSKSLLLMKYILAKFGLNGTKEFLKCNNVDIVKDCSMVNLNDNYVFPVRDMYIVVPKMLYDSIQIVQSFVYTLYSVIHYTKDISYEILSDTTTWIKALGAEFSSDSFVDTIYDKGISILGSLEFIYDRITMKDLKLDMENKADVYRVLRWMIFEFNSLRQKDNLNITTKKVRWAEYIASMYASRLAWGIYRISDKGDKADLGTVRKAIQIPPMYLIGAITSSKCQLVNYKNCVNDMDSLIALKYTYKGDQGIGEKSNAISSAYRAIHPSHFGRVDIDSSSNSDPGISGTICPFAELHDNHFSEYEEPNTWETELAKVLDAYSSMKSKVEMCTILEDHNLATKKANTSVLKDCIKVAEKLITSPIRVINSTQYVNGIDIFGDGYFFYFEE